MDNKNYGLKFDTFNENDYFLGGKFLGTIEILPSGDWTPFAPLPEYQSRPNFDTQSCVRFTICNALEMLFSLCLKEDKNFSDRFLSIVAGASRNGDSPKNVIETARKIGLIDEIDLPFDNSIDSLDKFFSPCPMTSNLLKKAKIFLENYKIGYEGVYPIGTNQTITKQNAQIMEALKRSPVGASVSAWHGDDKGGYDQIWRENHFCVILNGIDKDYWSIYDTYDNVIKKYSKKSKITMAKIYTVKKLITEDEQTIFTKFFDWVLSIVNKQATPETIKPVEVPVKKSDITIGIFALALQKTEGYFLPGTTANGVYYPKGSRAYRNNNPGCLSLRDAIGLTDKIDDIGLARFDTYKDGFLALTTKIKNICEGKSTKYSPENTILEFCQIYSPSFTKGNYPENKAKIIGKKLGVNYRVFKMCDLLL